MTVDDRYSYFPPPHDVVPQWHEPPPPPPLHKVIGPHLVTFGLTTGLLVLLGAPLALLWRVVAPPAVVLGTADGFAVEAPESDQVFAVDGWFVVVMLAVGVVLGAAAWYLLRDRGPAAPAGLAAGGLLAAAVAAAVGKRLVVNQYLYDFCQALPPEKGCSVSYNGTLHLQSTPAVVVLPVALLVGFLLMTFFFTQDPEAP